MLVVLSQSAIAGSILTAEELVTKLDDYQIIDTRPSAQFNGWPEAGETTGGHIVSAVHLSSDWLPGLSNEALRALLAEKGLTEETPVLLYGSPAQVAALSARLTQLGWPEPSQLDGGLPAWIEAGMPMFRLPRYRQLVHPQWLAARLEHGTTPKPRVLEVGWGELERDSQAHIPGAIYLDTNLLEEGPLWNRVSNPRLEQVLLSLGITAQTQVVLYGRNTSAAARAAHLMLYAGVTDVRLLDGGWTAWHNAGLPTVTKLNHAEPATAFGQTIPAKPELMIDLPQARQLLARDDAELVSIRSWREYTGMTSGYSYIAARGRIDGATWGHGGSDADHMEHFRNPDNTMRAAEELISNWRQWGVTRDKTVAFYCGTGWRASEAFFYAWLMGWDKISVFDGGWNEWSQDPANPVASGDPLRSNEARSGSY